MIKDLTPEQERLLKVYRDKWIAIGLSCEPCDFEQSKYYAKLAYEAAGLAAPQNFYLVDSPIAACKLAVELTGSSKEKYFENLIFGSHEAGWLSYYDFMGSVLGIKECSRLDGLIGLAKNCGWWSAYSDFAIFQHRHSELHLNNEGRLHNENGPAVKYRDGYSVWAINGNIITEQIVMSPETITLKQIHNEKNADVTSIMINRFGWHRYIQETKAKLIDNRDNEIEGTKEALYETKYGTRLLATCTTGRIFSMGVPDRIKSCEDAQEWLGRGKFNVIART